MNLQGRDLSPGMTGDDVLLLKIELVLLGFDLFEQPLLTHISQAQPVVDLYTPGVAAAVREVQAGCDLPQTGIVDEATAGCINAAVEQTDDYVAFGRVFGPDGESLPDVVVELLERDLPSREANGPRVIGEAQTTPTGYFITYNIQQFADGEAAPPSPDLQIRLPEIADEENTPITSTIYYNAPRVQIIDVHLSRAQQGQVESALSEYERHMARVNPIVGDITPDSWSAEDIGFLSGETGIPYEQVRFLHLDAVYREQLPEGVFYGILRQGGGPRLRQILAEKPIRNRRYLENALDANIIPLRLRQHLDEIMAMLEARAVELLSTAPQNAEERPGIGQIIGTAPIEGELQRRFITYWLHHQDEDGFWERLIEEEGFEEETINSLQFTLTASRLINDNFEVLQTLQEYKAQAGWRWPRDLARLSPVEWAELTGDETLADEIANRVEHAFPTAAVAYQVAPALDNNDLIHFFDINPDFNFKAPIDAQLENANPGNVEDRERLHENIKRLRRTMAIAPHYGRTQVMRKLIDADVTSAQQIVRTGKHAFVEMMTPIVGAETALLIHRNAVTQSQATALTLQQLGDFVVTPIGTLPSATAALEAEPELPTWAQLFGSLNACACEHCRSMYSPPAYMVDLFEFLKDAPGSPNALSVLLRRRPDLQHIKLDCANATIAMPYIDLVNEVLEVAISGTSVDWANYQTTVVEGETRAETERRLRAGPNPDHEYEHEAVYEELSDTEHPWNLPFDPAWERVRLFSTHLDIDFYALRRIFGADEKMLARDYLGLSQTEWNILTRPVSADNLPGVWGVAPDQLQSVPVFLRQSQLTFSELEALEDSHFLSSGDRSVAINRRSDPCDIEQFDLVELYEPPSLLEHIHRFLRLRRLLGWSIETLDIVLHAFGHVEISAPVLVDVGRVARLADSYGVTPSTVVTITGENLAKLIVTTEREASLFAMLIGLNEIDRLNTEERLYLLEEWQRFSKVDIDIRELAYILIEFDQTPPAFRPAEENIRTFLRRLHNLVQNALAEADDPSTVPVKTLIVDNLARMLDLPINVTSRLIQTTTDDAGITLPAVIQAQSTIRSTEIEDAIEDIIAFVQIDATTGEPDLVDLAEYTNAYLLLGRLHRVARLLRHLDIGRRELDVIVTTLVENNFLDLNQIRSSGDPVDTSVPERYAQWMQVVEACQLQRMMPRADRDLFDFLLHSEDTVSDWCDYINEHTGWDIDPVTGERAYVLERLLRDLQNLDTGDTLQLALFRQVDTYRRLAQTMHLLRRYRITPVSLKLWADGDPARVSEIADDLRSTAKARHHNNDESWYKVLTPLMDELREKKRDALLAYLIHNRAEFSSASDVYAEYLIDPEMSSCMLTSRIKQANAAIQLFVQRILINLEDALQAPDRNSGEWEAHWKQWEWMKEYRVAEANLKVFLYPENWIYPELRDNKSPFFIELENELLQDEIKQETIERAYRNYLWKLDEVAKLDVRGLYQDETTDTVRETLHVFARTNSTPHVYYYRHRDLKTKVWSAWEKVDLNIEGDHLIPVVHSSRLMLFWAVFQEKSDDDATYWSIKFNWSEYQGERWGPTRSHTLNSRLMTGINPQHSYFRAISEDEVLRIEWYQSPRHVQLKVPWGKRGETREVEMPEGIAVAQYVFMYDLCLQELVLLEDFSETHVALLPYRTEINNNTLREVNPDESGIDSVFVLDRVSGASVISETPGKQEWLEIPIIGWLVFLVAQIDWVDGLTALKESLRARSTDHPLLARTPGRFNLITDHQEKHFQAQKPFVLQMDSKAFIGLPNDRIEWGWLGSSTTTDIASVRFETFYHPYVCHLIREMNKGGIDGFLAPTSTHSFNRQLAQNNPSAFTDRYLPYAGVIPPQPENFDFSDEGAYSLYNWELFFHIPLLVATRLIENGHFKEAQRWFHYIFNPNDTSSHVGPARYWQVKPFFKLAEKPIETLSDLLRRIAGENTDAVEQVEAWRNDPFNPHAIARLRNIAYMKTTVMKYLDNLIAWGDDLFQRDTMESINEAAQLYILAAELLGPRPVTVAAQDPPTLTYDELVSGGDYIDAFSNAWLDLESMVPVDLGARFAVADAAGIPTLPYFCIPANDKLLSYWDTVADRLFKIRNCMNIEGQVRQLPLFEPPIDPALLVRARAAGLDLRNVLDMIGEAAVPNYRYAVMYQKALELCNEVRSLGNALLSALEKRDAEELTLLRSRHEGALLSQVRHIKDQQIKEADETLSGLKESRKVAEKRRKYYSSREYVSSMEQNHLDLLGAARDMEAVAEALEMAAGYSFLVPTLVVGTPPATQFGGLNLGSALRGIAGSFRFVASERRHEASKALTMSGYERRMDDWDFQADQATTELEQIDRQIAAAEIRLAIAERDLTNHDQQIEQNREVEDFLRRKFSNEELYGWMVGQLAALHHQVYKMAVDMARKAERAAQHELASEFGHVGFGHWDSLKKGLLAGERLHRELRQMDVAYMEANTRRMEITKHISLSMLDPLALIHLREEGKCQITLPEVLFDVDFAGHFNRRIKSVSLTIPCVTGPYTSISATLTLKRHAVRQQPGFDPLTMQPMSPQKSVATSSAQNESGLFELNFRDERFLPFEGFGVASEWDLQLPSPEHFPTFDYDTISDVILHLSYTAVDGRSQLLVIDGETKTFRSAVQDQLTSAVNAWIGGDPPKVLSRLFSLRHDFPNEWNRFMYGGDQQMDLPINREIFPFFARGANTQLSITGATLLIEPSTAPETVPHLELVLSYGDRSITYGLTETDEPDPFSNIGNVLHQDRSFTTNLESVPWRMELVTLPVAWQIADRLNPTAIKNIYLICKYEVNTP